MSEFFSALPDYLPDAAPQPAKYRTVALIAAAGQSTRMKCGSSSKLLLPIDGIPVLGHTLLAFENAVTVQDIVLVARKEDFSAFSALAEKLKISKLRFIVPGGETRQSSILNGLKKVPRHSRYIAIADGARCLITHEQINTINRAAYRYHAACAATRAVDTVKICDNRGFIDRTQDRSMVWLAQTPQTFSLSLYHAAAYYAQDIGFDATDDSMLVENINKQVRLIDCGRENIKITTPEDLLFAEAILHQRKFSRSQE